jgi:Bacterial membrane protein YfhO
METTGRKSERSNISLNINNEKFIFYMMFLATVVIVGAIVFPMFQRKVYPRTDLSTWAIPSRFFYAQCLAAGDDFCWCPDLWCGYYLHGEDFVGMYHPVHFVLYSMLPLADAFNVEFLLNYLILLAGSFLLLRRWNMGLGTSMFGSFVFTFFGFNIAHFVHIVVTSAVAHLPFCLVAIDGVMRGRSRRAIALCGLALAILTTSLLVVSAHPQTVWICGLIELAYSLFLLITNWAGVWRPAVLVLAQGLGILAGAIQIIPTLEVMRASNRAHSSREYASIFSMPPANVVQIFAPYLYRARAVAPDPADMMSFSLATNEFGLYAGAIVPVLVSWLWIRRRDLGRTRHLAWWALVLSVLGLFISFGAYTTFFEIYYRLPGFNLFRGPCRYRLIFNFGAMVLATIAFDDLARLVRRADRVPWRALGPLVVSPVASIVIGLGAMLLSPIWPETLHRYALSGRFAILAPIILFIATALLVALAARGFRYAILGLVVITSIDAFTYTLTMLRHDPPVSIATLVYSDLPTPPGDGPENRGRDFDDRVAWREQRFWEDRYLMRGIKQMQGFTSFLPNRQLDYRKDNSLQVAGAGWIRGRDANGVTWSPVPNPVPRARLVCQAETSHDPGHDLDGLDIQTAVLVDREVVLPRGRSGRATIISDRPGRIVIETEAESTQMLALGESYHEGWQVRVDGQPQAVVRVNGDFLGCVVDAGKHQVNWRFAPSSLWRGKQLSAMALALMLGWLAISFALPSSSRSGPNP